MYSVKNTLYKTVHTICPARKCPEKTCSHFVYQRITLFDEGSLVRTPGSIQNTFSTCVIVSITSTKPTGPVVWLI